MMIRRECLACFVGEPLMVQEGEEIGSKSKFFGEQLFSFGRLWDGSRCHVGFAFLVIADCRPILRRN